MEKLRIVRIVERFDQAFGEPPGIFRFQQGYDGLPFQRAGSEGGEGIYGAEFRGVA
jgi:hypothetical protein